MTFTPRDPKAYELAWADGVQGGTALDATNLNQMEALMASYVQAVIGDYDAYLQDNQLSGFTVKYAEDVTLRSATVPILTAVDETQGNLIHQIDCQSFGGLAVGDIVVLIWTGEVTHNYQYAATVGNFIRATDDAGLGNDGSIATKRTVKGALGFSFPVWVTTGMKHNTINSTTIDRITAAGLLRRYYNFYIYSASTQAASGDTLTIESYYASAKAIVLRP